MNTYCDDCKRCTGGNMRKSDVPGGDDYSRCWECEATIQAGMAESDAMISDLRAELDALRERVGKMEEALGVIVYSVLRRLDCAGILRDGLSVAGLQIKVKTEKVRLERELRQLKRGLPLLGVGL